MQDSVAGGVPECVVDGFEVIQVTNDHGLLGLGGEAGAGHGLPGCAGGETCDTVCGFATSLRELFDEMTGTQFQVAPAPEAAAERE